MSKFGFVAIVGRPNVGKSTLLNRLVGEKISIVSDKPQTTRSRILGACHHQGNQILFVDTPGIHRPGYRLNERMMEVVYQSLRETHLLVHMVDAAKAYGRGEEFVVDLLSRVGRPVLLVLNKLDSINKGRLLPQMEHYSKIGDYQEIIPISAALGDNTDLLLERIVHYLPEGEAAYPCDYLTDQSERSICSEIIREKVLAHTRQELPYCSAVLIEEFEETRREHGFVRLIASVIVEKISQKRIVIGRGGQMIKQIGTEAREEIQSFLGVRKVYLDLNVKTVMGWRNQDSMLDDLGVR